MAIGKKESLVKKTIVHGFLFTSTCKPFNNLEEEEEEEEEEDEEVTILLLVIMKDEEYRPIKKQMQQPMIFPQVVTKRPFQNSKR
jgi:hypothetical protein